MRSKILAVVLFAGMPALSWAQSNNRTDQHLRTTVGVVVNGATDDGQIWFELEQIDQRFVFDPRKVPCAEDIWKAIDDSSKTNKSVSVHYYIDGATFGYGDDKPIFTVHDLTYNGRTMEALQSLPPKDPDAVPLDRDVAAASLAKGIALAGDPNAAEALNALSAAVDSNALEAPLRTLALKARSSNNEEHAIVSAAGADRDRMFFAAYTDALAWQTLAPDSSEAAMRVARIQGYLGAYDDALAGYRRIIDKWPDQLFWAEIRTAVIYRRLAQYDKALAALDEIVRREGAQDGMAYHYHRGWILNLSGRYPEAIAEFTEGLKNQPDYQGAFMFRACAFAQTGDLKDAIADQEKAIAQFGAYGGDTPLAASAAQDRSRADEVLKQLKEAFSKNPNEKVSAPCMGYSDWAEQKRERSPLLPLAAVH